MWEGSRIASTGQVARRFSAALGAWSLPLAAAFALAAGAILWFAVDRFFSGARHDALVALFAERLPVAPRRRGARAGTWPGLISLMISPRPSDHAPTGGALLQRHREHPALLDRLALMLE